MRQRLSLEAGLLGAALALAPAALPGTAGAVPRSIHPALSHIVPGEAISERFLARDRDGGVLVDLIVEGDVSLSTLSEMGVEVNTTVGGFLTARCPLARLPELLSTPGVERVQISERCEPTLDLSALDVGLPAVRAVPPPGFLGQTGAGVLVGIVDTGIDYSHGDFQRPDGKTRLVSIWDQGGSGSSPPTGFTYGAEWDSTEINAAIATEIDAEGHGTHVMGIAAGDGSMTGNGQPAYQYVGVAPEAALCVVKTTFSTSSIADGVSYIFQKAAALGMQAVVNLSLSTQDGPHDGTYGFDTMINQLTGPGKIVVASAGNKGQDNLHGQVTVSQGGPSTMTLTVPSYTRAPQTGNDYLLFSGWYEGADEITLTITSPNGITIGPVVPGSSTSADTNDGFLNVNNATTAPLNGDHEIYIELFDQFSNKAPQTGTWTFTFTPVSIASTGRVDMYISSNHLGSGSSLAMWSQGLVFGGVIGSPGTADSVICVAAHTTKDCWDSVNGLSYCWNPAPTVGAIASFSSQGPRRDSVLKPDLSAPGFGVSSALSSDYNPVLPLINTDGVHFNQGGTSMSSPHVAGSAALLLAQSYWTNATPSQIRARLTGTARADAFASGLPNAVWGYGKLDLPAALAPPPALVLPHPAKGEFVPPGKPDSITLVVTGFSADSLSVSLSTDGGATYPIRLGAIVNVNPGPPLALVFFVEPSMVTTQAKARAIAYQGGTPTMTSHTDSLFLIAAPTAVETAASSPPPRFALSANTPNPFNPATTIRFETDRDGPVTLRIYAVSGALIRTLVSGSLPAGGHRATWDGRDAGGRAVGSGVYVYQLDLGGKRLARKMSLLK